MDKEFNRQQFETLKIKASVAKKFRKYCRKISKSQSMTLLLMLEFFESHGLSPEEDLGPHINTLESLLKKRFNSVIAIIRDIEKHQTKPTAAMMQSLFTELEADPQKIPSEKAQNSSKPTIRFVERKQNKD